MVLKQAYGLVDLLLFGLLINPVIALDYGLDYSSNIPFRYTFVNIVSI